MKELGGFVAIVAIIWAIFASPSADATAANQDLRQPVQSSYSVQVPTDDAVQTAVPDPVQPTAPIEHPEPVVEYTRPTEPVDYYENTHGESVQSPTHYDNGAPAGASAMCEDGSYSFSRSRRGTCSGHGGVSTWL